MRPAQARLKCNRKMTNQFSPLLDPEIADALSKLDLTNRNLSLSALGDIRAAKAAQPPASLSDNVARIDYRVPSRPNLSVRVHREKVAHATRSAIYWMHGGGDQPKRRSQVRSLVL